MAGGIARDYLYQRARWGVLEREISRIVLRCEALGAYPCFRRALAARSLLSYTAGGGGRHPQLSSLGLRARREPFVVHLHSV